MVFVGIGSKDFKFMRELPDALAMYFDKALKAPFCFSLEDFEKPKLENVQGP